MTQRHLLIMIAALLAGSLASFPARAWAYDRNAASQYADQYALVPNSNWYTFTGDDCTNFISQALQTGGETQVNQNYLPQNDNAWYMWQAPNWVWSNSWSVSGDNWQFMSNTGRAHQMYSVSGATYTTAHSGAYAGDLLYYAWYYRSNPPDASIWHMAIQVQDNFDEKNNWTSVVDSHSSFRYHANWTLFDFNRNATTTQIYIVHVV